LKKTIQRPHGRKHKGGWVIQPESLLKALRMGEAVELGKITVGTKTLMAIIRDMEFPDQELLIHANGKLEFQNIGRTFVKTPAGPTPVKCVFRLPRLRQYFSICDGAWMPKVTKTLVVLKPKKY